MIDEAFAKVGSDLARHEIYSPHGKYAYKKTSGSWQVVDDVNLPSNFIYHSMTASGWINHYKDRVSMAESNLKGLLQAFAVYTSHYIATNPDILENISLNIYAKNREHEFCKWCLDQWIGIETEENRANRYLSFEYEETEHDKLKNRYHKALLRAANRKGELEDYEQRIRNKARYQDTSEAEIRDRNQDSTEGARIGGIGDTEYGFRFKFDESGE